MQDPKRHDAMGTKIDALKATWSLIDLPFEKKLIGCKWVCKLKLNHDGSVKQYKSRLMAKGYNQRKVLIIPKMLLMWLKLSSFAPSLPLLHLVVGTFTNLILIMPSSIAIYFRMSICNFHLDSDERGEPEFASFINRICPQTSITTVVCQIFFHSSH